MADTEREAELRALVATAVAVAVELLGGQEAFSAALARRLGRKSFSRPTVSKWTTKKQQPSASRLIAIAEAAHVSVDALLDQARLELDAERSRAAMRKGGAK